MSISLNGDGIVSGVTTFTTPLTGVTTFSSVVVGSGSTSIPSISPSGDNNTGVFFPSADTVALSSGGTERLKVDSDGNINIDSGGVYYDAVNNRFAIGTTSPAEKLQVDGSAIFKATNSYLGFQNASGTSTGYIQGQSSFLAIAGDTGSSNTIAFYPASTEAARIDSSGRLLVGTSSARTDFFDASSTYTPRFQLEGSDASGSTMMSLVSNNSAGLAPYLVFALQKSGSSGGDTVVADGNELGHISFQGNDGSEMVSAANITAQVDGTPGANDMPGRLVFSTTADGASSPTERMRITSSGAFGLGGANYGTSGQVLTSQGSSAAPQWATPSGGSLVLIASVNAAGATTATFTSGIGSNYFVYKIFGCGIQPGSSSALLWQTSIDGGSSYSVSMSTYGFAWNTSLSPLRGSYADGRVAYGTAAGDDWTANASTDFELTFFNHPSANNQKKQAFSHAVTDISESGNLSNYSFASINIDTTSLINAMRFTANGATFSKGIFYLYGVKTS